MIYAIFSEGEYPVEARNQAARAGKLGATIQSILADLKPRLCISPRQWSRTAFLFLKMNDASQIPAIAEPCFLALNGSIKIHPVMVPDLARASSAIEEAAAKKYT